MPPVGRPGGGGRGPVHVPFSKFPLSASSDGRYLQTPNGTPFRLHGDSFWEIFNELDSTEVDTVLADCQSRGFNALITQATNSVKYVASSHAPGAKGASDAKPWLLNISGGTWAGTFANHDAAFSSPNPTYWDWVDYVIARMRTYGILSIIDFSYDGFNGGADDGWWQDMSNAGNTQAVCFEFGRWLGTRWRNHQNLILDLGVDMFPTTGSEASARKRKMAEGLRAAGCGHLMTGHYQRSSDANDYAEYADLITLNSVYPGAGGSGYAPPHGRCRRAYNRSPAVPAVMVEGEYEFEFANTRRQVRENLWWSQLSVIGGTFYGNGAIWTFASAGDAMAGGGTFAAGWASHLSDPGRVDHQRMGAFLNERQWHTLVPNGLGSIGTLITSGGGSAQTIGSVGTADTNDGTDYVAAAANPGGTLLVAYRPHGNSSSVVFDATKMSGAFSARKFDPTNAAVTTLGTGIANTGTYTFSSPGANNAGDNDWVYLLEKD